MPPCINHPETEAEATCSVCGRPFCHECLVPGADPPMCTTCAINRAGSQAATEPKGVAAVHPASRSHRAFFWTSGVLVLCIIGELGWMVLGRSRPATVPDTPQMARVLAMDDLILVQSALATAKEDQGRYPALTAIEDQVPVDVANVIRAGRITMTRTAKGFLLRMQPAASGPPLIMNQDGDLVTPPESPAP